MSVDNTAELSACLLPARRLLQEMPILREQNPSQFRRTVQQLIIRQPVGAILRRSQDVHAPIPQVIGDLLAHR